MEEKETMIFVPRERSGPYSGMMLGSIFNLLRRMAVFIVLIGIIFMVGPLL